MLFYQYYFYILIECYFNTTTTLVYLNVLLKDWSLI